MPTARDRLLDTARRLFLVRGVPNVGINEVIETAKVARMTLYNHFPSKEALVQASFEAEAERRREAIAAAQAEATGPQERVLAAFRLAETWIMAEGFRGCAFVNLAVETAAPDGPHHDLARQHKLWIRDSFRKPLRDAGASGADGLAEQLLVLWDGAIVGAYLRQSSEPVRAARAAAESLLAAALPHASGSDAVSPE